MLTIFHDRIAADGEILDVAYANGHEVRCQTRATCNLAGKLIDLGYCKDEPVRIVRADPLLYGPPFYVSGIRLSLVAKFDLLP